MPSRKLSGGRQANKPGAEEKPARLARPVESDTAFAHNGAVSWKQHWVASPPSSHQTPHPSPAAACPRAASGLPAACRRAARKPRGSAASGSTALSAWGGGGRRTPCTRAVEMLQDSRNSFAHALPARRCELQSRQASLLSRVFTLAHAAPWVPALQKRCPDLSPAPAAGE